MKDLSEVEAKKICKIDYPSCLRKSQTQLKYSVRLHIMHRMDKKRKREDNPTYPSEGF